MPQIYYFYGVNGTCSAVYVNVAVFSSAHVLGEAMERVYGGHLCYGPPIEQGFYYDMYSDEYNVSQLIIS